MNRQEPYIGMPIVLGNFDEEPKPMQMVEPRRPMESRPEMDNRQPMQLAMAYVPWQRWNQVYSLEEGLHHGTIFPDLFFPFEGGKRGGGRR